MPGRGGKGGRGKPRYRRAPRKVWRRKPKVVVNRAIAPIPQRYITKHKYSTTITINTSVPVYRFNLNSLWDPDQTGTGHQPYGFDQLAALFNRYRVIGCSYVISGYQANNPIRIGAVATNDSATPSNMASLIELPRSRFTTQIPGGARAQIKGYVDLASLTGRTRAQYMADDRYQAQNNANPQEALMLNVMAALLNDNSVDGCLMTVTLQYHAEWFDPIVYATS